MKKLLKCIAVFILLIISGCSGSEVFRGDWKATNDAGEQYQINFQEKNFTVTAADGVVTNYGYTQNTVNITNGVETYGLNLEDGRTCQINFPIAEDESVGVLLDGNDRVLYTISRTEYLSYKDVFALD